MEIAQILKTEMVLKDKLLELGYFRNKLDYCKEVLRRKNDEVNRLKNDINKKSLEIHLPYTYKKRFNSIVKENQNGSNYPRARTSTRQEVTIGNVLDYLDRVVEEKNNLKSEMKIIKKEKKKISNNFKLSSNRSNPRTLNNLRKLSETEGSEISATEFSKKTFDNQCPKKDLRDATTVMLQGKTNVKYNNLLAQGKKKSIQ